MLARSAFAKVEHQRLDVFVSSGAAGPQVGPVCLVDALAAGLSICSMVSFA
jgi:hypothetical protein